MKHRHFILWAQLNMVLNLFATKFGMVTSTILSDKLFLLKIFVVLYNNIYLLYLSK